MSAPVAMHRLSASLFLPFLALVPGVAGLAASTGEAPAASRPAFVTQPGAESRVTVTGILSLNQGDAVRLSGGALGDLRRGAVCTVSRDGKAVAEVILVTVEESRAIGLLLKRFNDRSVQPGDLVTLKTRQVS
ncbi:MAG: hypothetical protein ACFE0O_09665 [Opitutales bacterium]